MAIYINLYHEIQKQKLQRQRDPFKIAIMVALIIAMLFIGYYLWKLQAASSAKAELSKVKGEWSKLEPKRAAAQARVDELKKSIDMAAAIIHRSENRFYWGPFLVQLMHIVPGNVQLTGLSAKESGEADKSVTLEIGGIATGDQPREVADQLRTMFQSKLSANYESVTSVFKSLEDAGEPVKFQGKSVPAAIFSIEINFVRPDVTKAANAPAGAKPGGKK